MDMMLRLRCRSCSTQVGLGILGVSAARERKFSECTNISKKLMESSSQAII